MVGAGRNRRPPLAERGLRAFERGNYAEAVGSLAEAARRHPGYADVRNLLGLALHLAGHSEEAIEQFRAALAINPHYAEVHLNLALVLNDLGRLEEARASFVRAQQAENGADGLGRTARARLANRHAELGDLYRAHGRSEDAVEEYRRALALAPGFHDIRLVLARTYLDAGSTTLAASEFGKVLAAKPDDVPARLGLGLALLEAGERGRARALWEECRRLAPEDRAAEVYLARL